jgi:GTP-binding protein
VDIAPPEGGAALPEAVRAIVRELRKYDEALYRKPRWLVFNKVDALAPAEADARIARVRRALRWKGPWFKVSALTGAGCRELCNAAHRFLAASTKDARSRRAA